MLSTKPVHFGWTEGHGPIEELGILLLPKNCRIKPLLNQHISLIQKRSDEMDMNPELKGANHFCNSENHGGLVPEIRIKTHSDDSFEQMKQLFNKARLSKLQKLFQAKDYNIRLEKILLNSVSGKNVYKASINAYNQTVKAMVQWLQDLPNSGKNSKSKEKVLCQIGKLAHFVGDLNQPFHVSRYFDWKLLSPFCKSDERSGQAHWDSEKYVFTEENYANWLNKIETKYK
jgi:hypothetical protein